MKKTALYLLIVTISMSCASSPVLVDQDLFNDFNLYDYQSFDFLDVNAADTDNPNFQQNISYLKESISKKMLDNGLKREENNPELKINLGIVVKDQVQTRQTNLSTDPFMYTGQQSYTWKTREIPINTYKEGTLTMHLIDPQTNQPVWIGTISRALPTKAKNTPSTIDDTVKLLFKKMKYSIRK